MNKNNNLFMRYKEMNWKSILFFVILFGAIVVAYFYYEWIGSLLYSSMILKVIVVVMAMLSIAFPHVMDYLKYSDGNYSLYDVMRNYHGKR